MGKFRIQNPLCPLSPLLFGADFMDDGRYKTKEEKEQMATLLTQPNKKRLTYAEMKAAPELVRGRWKRGGRGLRRGWGKGGGG